MFWLATVIGRAYRNSERAIRVPVRYYEASAVKTRARSKSEGRTSQYKLGKIKTELTTRNLQLMVRLNAMTKAGYQKIYFHDMNKLGHLATRWLENAKGNYDVNSDGDEE